MARLRPWLLPVLCVLAAAPAPVALLAAAPSAAAETESLLKSVFFRLPGTWRGTGNFGGLPSRIEMTWTPAFDSHYMRMSWHSEMTSRTGDTVKYEGEATYVPLPDGFGIHAGTWYDSQGQYRRLEGRARGDSLVAIWGGGRDTLGRTTYRFLDARTLFVRDELKSDGTWAVMGLSTLERAPAAAH